MSQQLRIGIAFVILGTLILFISPESRYWTKPLSSSLFSQTKNEVTMTTSERLMERFPYLRTPVSIRDFPEFGKQWPIQTQEILRTLSRISKIKITLSEEKNIGIHFLPPINPVSFHDYLSEISDRLEKEMIATEFHYGSNSLSILLTPIKCR